MDLGGGAHQLSAEAIVSDVLRDVVQAVVTGDVRKVTADVGSSVTRPTARQGWPDCDLDIDVKYINPDTAIANATNNTRPAGVAKRVRAIESSHGRLNNDSHQQPSPYRYLDTLPDSRLFLPPPSKGASALNPGYTSRHAVSTGVIEESLSQASPVNTARSHAGYPGYTARQTVSTGKIEEGLSPASPADTVRSPSRYPGYSARQAMSREEREESLKERQQREYQFYKAEWRRHSGQGGATTPGDGSVAKTISSLHGTKGDHHDDPRDKRNTRETIPPQDYAPTVSDCLHDNKGDHRDARDKRNTRETIPPQDYAPTVSASLHGNKGDHHDDARDKRNTRETIPPQDYAPTVSASLNVNKGDHPDDARDKRNTRETIPPQDYAPTVSASLHDNKGDHPDDARDKRNTRETILPQDYAPTVSASLHDNKGDHHDDARDKRNTRKAIPPQEYAPTVSAIPVYTEKQASSEAVRRHISIQPVNVVHCTEPGQKEHVLDRHITYGDIIALNKNITALHGQLKAFENCLRAVFNKADIYEGCVEIDDANFKKGGKEPHDICTIACTTRDDAGPHQCYVDDSVADLVSEVDDADVTSGIGSKRTHGVRSLIQWIARCLGRLFGKVYTDEE